MKVLIMDNHPELMKRINEHLSGCDVVGTYEAFEQKIRTERYACYVLDAKEGQYPVIQLIQNLKLFNKQAGLIVTSPRDSLHERIEALNKGADDFLTRPFELSELSARIQALLRRTSSSVDDVMVYKEIRIDQRAKAVFVNGLLLDLTRKELELLIYFLDHKNSIIKKGDLISYLSGQLSDFKSNPDIIYAHVKNLKKKLGESGCKMYLKTIYGTGYKWED